MAYKVKDIIDEVLALPANSRAYVAEVLLESLDFEEGAPVNDAWREEIEKRCREIDTGEVQLIAGEDAMADLRSRFLSVQQIRNYPPNYTSKSKW